MPLAKDVATELRMLADALDKQPDAEIVAPYISFMASHEKNLFLETVKLLPRPLKKKILYEDTNYSDIEVRFTGTKSSTIRASVAQSSMCTLVRAARPAEYRCEPLLSELEEEMIEV